jgi:hypothetical protein
MTDRKAKVQHLNNKVGGTRMLTELAVETLKSGERMRVLCVTAPDTEWESQIRPFLAHKPPNYTAHIEGAFAGACGPLETRFYIGVLNGEMVGNIMTTEQQGVGIFGHVHTRSDQRRKGICSAIMRHQMEEFRRRKGKTLLLGTGYQSAAYHIYASFGFRDWKVGRPGLMRYESEDYADFEAQFFAPSAVRPARAEWRHWPLVSLLASLPTEIYMRSLTLDVWGVTLLEGPYCHFLHKYEGNPDASAAVLELKTGAVVALATCVPDARWRGAVALLDLFQHPNVTPDDLVALLEALPLPSGRIQCFTDPRDGVKSAALERSGFRQEAVLTNQFREGESGRDAILYGR